MAHPDLLTEAYERLAAADTYPRHPSEYTHAEVLAAVLLIASEYRDDAVSERALTTALLAEMSPVRHLRAA